MSFIPQKHNADKPQHKSADQKFQAANDQHIIKQIKDIAASSPTARLKMAESWHVKSFDSYRKESWYKTWVEKAGEDAALITLIKGEIEILNNQEGHGVWLIGQRLAMAQEKKLYRLAGYESVIEMAEDMFSIKKSSVYNYIAIYKTFPAEDAAFLGARLYLLLRVAKDIDGEVMKETIREIIRHKLSHRQTEELIKHMDSETSTEDVKRLVDRIANPEPLLESREDASFNQSYAKVADDGQSYITDVPDIARPTVTAFSPSVPAEPAVRIEMSSIGGELGEDGVFIKSSDVKMLEKAKYQYAQVLFFKSQEEREAVMRVVSKVIARPGYVNDQIKSALDEWMKVEKKR